MVKASALAIALLTTQAYALEPPVVVGAHIATWHDRQGYCNFNPGLYFRWKSGLTAGMYENSDCRFSTYAGWTWSNGPFSLTAAVVTGYAHHDPMPALIPSVVIPLRDGVSARIAFIPKAEKHSANAIHFMLERSFP